jgi:hypothetical protein
MKQTALGVKSLFMKLSFTIDYWAYRNEERGIAAAKPNRLFLDGFSAKECCQVFVFDGHYFLMCLLLEGGVIASLLDRVCSCGCSDECALICERFNVCCLTVFISHLYCGQV